MFMNIYISNYFIISMRLLFVCYFILCLHTVRSEKVSFEEERYGVKYATDCEVCKLVTKELNEKLDETDSSGVIEIGYALDSKKKITKYNKSELRLVEVLESVCGGLVDYRVHKERHDSTRWAKQMSQTFSTLHGLVNKGVKVELGIPYELWDEPSAEVTQLKTQCEQFIEANEDSISTWYYDDIASRDDLQSQLCPALLTDVACLAEPYGESIKSEEKPPEEEMLKPFKYKKQAKKGETGEKTEL